MIGDRLRHYRCPDCGRFHSDDDVAGFADEMWCNHAGAFFYNPRPVGSPRATQMIALPAQALQLLDARDDGRPG